MSQHIDTKSIPPAFSRAAIPIFVAAPTSAVASRKAKPNGLRTLKLDLASACNIACDYCFVDEGRVLPGPKLMGLDTIERAISWFTAEDTTEPCVIVLFGGEPLLNSKGVSLICERVSSFRKSGSDVRLQMITNAMLVTTTIARQLAMADATVMVSIDGTQEIHDTHRIDHSGLPTYARVIKGLRILQAHLSADRIWARATMSAGVPQIAYFRELSTLGVRNISLGYIDDNPPEGMSLAQYESELDEILNSMTEAARGGQSVQVHPISTYLSLEYGKIGRGESWPQYDCGAATRIASVTPDGTIFPCEHAVMARDRVDWSIGSINTGIDATRVADFLAATSKSHSGCSTCSSSSSCDLGCRVDYTLANQQSECHAKDALLFSLWKKVRHWYKKLAEEEPAVLMRMVDPRLHSFIRST